MEIPSAEVIFSSREALDKGNEDRFWSWVGSADDQKLTKVFDTAVQLLYVMKQVAVIRRPHVEFELTFTLERIVSHAFAVLALLEKGFVAESCLVLRMISEGCNLIKLLSGDEDELKVYLSSDEDHRDSNFRDSKVRSKLKAKPTDFIDGRTYGLMSRRFAHFSTGSVHLNSSVYQMDFLGGLEAHQGVMVKVICFWASLIYMATHFGLMLVNFPPDDPEVRLVKDEMITALEVLHSRLGETND